MSCDMNITITDDCICCGACLDSCPAEAIVEDEVVCENKYFINQVTCNCCSGHSIIPICSEECPLTDAIIWDIDTGD